jgi:hypothetical protein
MTEVGRTVHAHLAKPARGGTLWLPPPSAPR